jgi:hypothetical protein
MGNLPRSRPGRRSAKRSGSTTRAKTAAPAKKRTTTRASTAAKKPAPRARPQAQRHRPAPATARKGNDPVGQAVELAGKVAAIGVRTAAGIVKRLPRP